MGQFLIVHGSDPDGVRSVFRSGVRFLESHGAGARDATFEAGATAVAHFPRRLVAAPPALVHVPGSPAWSVSAGCWLRRGRADPETQSELGEALEAGISDWRRAAAELEGFFAIAAGDPDGHAVTLATDRTGTTHVYRARVGGCEVVSTSALVLGALTGFGFDGVAVREFLATGSVFEDRSLFAKVEKLPPGLVLRFRDGRLVERRSWWELRPLLWSGQAPASGSVPALAEALTGAVDRLLAAHPGAVLDLTGGFDTRVILGAALATGRPFRTAVTGPDEAGDVVAAGRVARELGLRHTHLQPGLDYGTRSPGDLLDALTLTDGEFDVAEYAGIAQVHSRLAGDGGDGGLTVNGSAGELCRGYWWGLLPSLDAPGSAFDARRIATGCFAEDGWAEEMLGGRLAGTKAPCSLVDHFTGVIERATADLCDLPGVALIDAVYLTLRMQRWAGRLISSTDRLWPCVSPFMFEGPMRAMLSAPPELRRRDRMARLLIGHLNSSLATLPMADGSPVLPIRRWSPRRRRLRGTSPVVPVHVIAGLVADLAATTRLDPDSMLTGDLYDPAALAAFAGVARRPGFGDASRLGRMVTLEMVARAVAPAK